MIASRPRPLRRSLVSSLLFFVLVASAALVGGCQVGGGIGDEADREPEIIEADLVLDGEAHRVALQRTDEGYALEGDMLVTELLVPELAPPQDSTVFSLSVTPQNLLWPGGVVYYTISPSLPDKQRVYTAMDRWSAVTPIRFVPRTSQRDYVTFQPSTVCSAHVGRIGGQQFVNLGPHCNLGLTIHEIGHALGLFHEHTRPDRDSYVTVYWNNIPAGLQSQYWINGAARRRGAYDIASIMHYGSYEFTSNGFASMLRRSNGAYLLHPNEKGYPSAGDGAGIRSLYSEVACPLGDGRYCGGVYVGGKEGNLYQCTAGQLQLVEACSAGCFTAPPGEPDRCNEECEFGDGLYCGKNGVSGAPGTLYRCAGGTRTRVEQCDAGCEANDPGEEDACATTCPFGDGVYCGGNHIAGDPASLYQCTAGQISLIESCEAGCFRAPTGEPDACNTECPLGDGLYCGGNHIGGQEGTLYRCEGGEITAEEQCASGCFEAPPGQPDRCN